MSDERTNGLGDAERVSKLEDALLEIEQKLTRKLFVQCGNLHLTMQEQIRDAKEEFEDKIEVQKEEFEEKFTALELRLRRAESYCINLSDSIDEIQEKVILLQRDVLVHID